MSSIHDCLTGKSSSLCPSIATSLAIRNSTDPAFGMAYRWFDQNGVFIFMIRRTLGE